MAIRSATAVATRPQVLRTADTLTRSPAISRATVPTDSFDAGRVQNQITAAQPQTAAPATQSSGGFFGSLFSGILGGLKSLASSLLGSVQNTVVSGLGNLVNTGKEWLSNTIDSLATKASNWVSGLFSKLIGKLGG